MPISSVDLTDPRVMLEALMLLHRPRRMLRDTFFSSIVESPTDHVDIDIYVGKRKMAPFVNQRNAITGNAVTGYTTSTYRPPCVKESTILNPQDLLSRSAGEPLYSTQPIASRAEKKIADELLILDDQISRREEWMCAQALFYGKIPISGVGISEEIDFGFASLPGGTHLPTLTLGDRWDQSTSDPLGDLYAWAELAAIDSGLVPNIAIVGKDALKALLANEKFKSQLDTNNLNIASINPQKSADGSIFVGYFPGLGMSIYSYAEYYYDDDAEALAPIVPTDRILLGNTNARTAMAYGAIEDVEWIRQAGALVQSQRWPTILENKNPSVMQMILQAKPLPVPVQAGAFVSAKVI